MFVLFQAQCTDDVFEFDKIQYTLDFRIIDGDVGLPQNSFRTSDFLPHGEWIYLHIEVVWRDNQFLMNLATEIMQHNIICSLF